MKLHRLFIIAFAAGAGTLCYKFQSAWNEQQDPRSVSSSSSRNFYSNVAGSGSLARTVRSSSDAQNAGKAPSPAPTQQTGLNNQKHSGSNAVEDMTPDDLPIIQAAAKGDKNLVERRLSAHVKVDSRDAERRTPLMYAAWNGFDDIANRLLAAGANAELRDRDGNNTFDYAASRGLTDSLHFLLQRTHKQDGQRYEEYAMLMQAVYAGDVAYLPQGNARLVSVNRVNPEGQSPLHILAANGTVALMDAVVKRGADVNLVNGGKQTPLHFAAWNNQVQTVQYLIAHGANMAATDMSGNTALILAAQNNSTDAAKMLVMRGADKYTSNKDGKNAAIMAEDNGFSELALLLK